MSLSPSRPPTAESSPRHFRGSLARTLVLGLVILSVIPAFVLSIGFYFRSRDVLRSQATSQLQTIIDNHVQQLQQIPIRHQEFLTQIALKDNIQFSLQNLFQNLKDDNWQRTTRSVLISDGLPIGGAQEKIDQVSLVLPDGKVLLSTNNEWLKYNLNQISTLQPLVGSKTTVALYNAVPFYANQFAFYSSNPLKNAKGDILLTMIISSRPALAQSLLASAGSLFPNAQASYYLSTDELMRIDPATNEIVSNPHYVYYFKNISDLIMYNDQGKSGEFSTNEGKPVLAYGKYVSDLKLGMLVEVPQETIYSQINQLVIFSGVFLIIILAVSILIVTLGARSIISEINILANRALRFSEGDWSQQVVVRRNDEIGLLGNTFNTMVNQLRDLYQSMERKVEERSKQLRLAFEIGQLAVSSNKKEEILNRTVNVLPQRFGYSAAMVFMVDTTGTFVSLDHISENVTDLTIPTGYRVYLSSNSLVGRAGKSNQPELLEDISTDETLKSDLWLKDTRSVAAVPISVGNQVLGVIEVQSKERNTFDSDAVAALTTLANQIANGLQNIRLNEATQINLEETVLLYRTSRQITQAQSEKDLLEIINNTLTQTQYVSGLFAVEEEYVSILSITDPRSPTGLSAAQGITLPLQKIESRLKESNLIIVENLAVHNEFENLLAFFSRRGCRSAALLSVMENDHLSKIIVLGSRESTPLNLTTLQPYANLAEVISTALSRFRALDNLELRVNELSTLASFSQALSVETDLSHLYQVLHQQVIQTIGGNVGFLVALYDKEKSMIQIPYVYEGSELITIPPFPLGEGLTSYVIKNRQPLFLVKDTEKKAEELGAKISGKSAKSWMGVPLIVGGEIMGVLVVQDTDREERFKPSDLSLFTTIAPQIATAVRNAQLLTQMSQALKAYDQERFLLNTLLLNIPDEVSFKDKQGKFIRVSESYAKEYNIPPEALIGKTEAAFLDPYQAEQINALEFELLQSGRQEINQVEKYTRKSGQPGWLDISKIPMVDQFGTSAGLLQIKRDISGLKQAEELAQQRSQQLVTAAEIAREATGTLDVEQLLQKAVNLVRERFGFYHASIFLIDELREFAVLKESTGDVGARMKASGHRLAVGSQSIVGQATSQGQAFVINDVRNDPTYYPNPLLPNTRAELAIPLKVGDQILGSLDVQSDKVNAFLPEDVNILQTLTDQIAIAVLNASLFARAQDNLAQHRLLHQITIAAASATTMEDAIKTTVQAIMASRGGGHVSLFIPEQDDYLQVRASAGSEDVDLTSFRLKIGEGVVGQAAMERHPVRVNDIRTDPNYVGVVDNTRSELAVPILYSDRLMGVLNIESSEVAAFDEVDQEIFGTLGNNLGAILANAQLVEAVRNQVERQRVLYEVTSKIRRTVDIESILETSATEICKVVNARKARIQIAPEITEVSIRSTEPHSRDNGKEAGR